MISAIASSTRSSAGAVWPWVVSTCTASRLIRATSEPRMPSATSRLVPWISSGQSTAAPRNRVSSASSGASPAGSTSTRSTRAIAS